MRAEQQTTKMIGYLLPILRGIFYPFLKISMIALSEKLLKEALTQTVDKGLLTQLEETVFDKVKDSDTTSIFLMEPLTFWQTFMVVTSIVLILCVVQPLANSMITNHLCYEEVKRLQSVLYKRFILEPNSVPIKEASDLLYTKIAVIEKYWANSKLYVYSDSLLQNRLTEYVMCDVSF